MKTERAGDSAEKVKNKTSIGPSERCSVVVGEGGSIWPLAPKTRTHVRHPHSRQGKLIRVALRV